MYDRVIRRKYGLLCNDDTSNEDFINSYINRLDCTPINLQCVDSQPCSESTTITECNLILEVDVIVNENNQYVFTSSILNTIGTPVYNWTYDSLHWIFISNTGGVLILQPINQTSSITTIVSLIVEDERGCKDTFSTGKLVYLGGCTDSTAINYNPNATFDNGTCYYIALSFSISYICQPDTSGTISLVITGGLAPYTVIGTQNGTNLPNGSTYSAYVIDSIGNTTPIQSGTISCPFDCGTIEIVDNFDSVCLVDELGNNTGQAQVFCTPSGGTAPYTITISVNGNPPIPFINGSTYTNLDELIIYIVDANNCDYESIPYIIDCPPYSPGGSGTCDELESEFEAAGTEFYLGLRTTDRNFTGGGYSLEYDIAFGVINLPVGYTTANISNIDYTVENISPVGLLQQYHSGACTICADNMGFPAINGNNLSGVWGTVANFYSNYSFDCDLNSTEIQVLRLQVNAVITFTNETNICYLCVSSEIEVEYLPCDRVFLTSQAVQMINPSFCDGTMPISPINCPAINYKQDWTITQIKTPGDPIFPYSASMVNISNIFTFSPGIGTWVTTVDLWNVIINSIDNGTVCGYFFPPPCSTTQVSGGFPGVASNSGPTSSTLNNLMEIIYPDNLNRVSNINLTVYIKLENGCEYEGTFDITIDGNILGDTDSSGIISLTEL